MSSNVSRHRTGGPGSFSLDALSKVWTLFLNNLSVGLWPQWQALLEDRFTDLEDLIRSEDGQTVSRDLQKLVAHVLGEIEGWLDRKEGPMATEAQITLSNMSCNGPIKHNMCSKVLQIYPFNSAYST